MEFDKLNEGTAVWAVLIFSRNWRVAGVVMLESVVGFGEIPVPCVRTLYEAAGFKSLSE